MSNLRKVGALWLNDGPKGKYMSGKIEEAIPAGTKMLVFKNDYKTESKHPNYQVFIEATEDKPPESELATEVESYSDTSIPF